MCPVLSPTLSIKVLKPSSKNLVLEIIILCYFRYLWGIGCGYSSKDHSGNSRVSLCVKNVAIPYVQNVLDDDGNALDDKLNTDVKPMLDQLVWAATAVRNHRKCAELPVSSFFGS